MTTSVGAAGWYLDPQHPGTQRYFDGANWTDHRSPLPSAPFGFQGWWTAPQWKGSKLGLPPNGPGSLAEPGRRLGARLLDVLVLLPVFAVILTVALVLVIPHAGPIFPPLTATQNPSTPPGFIWIELTVIGTVLLMGVIMLAYETIATARYGRTLGKAWLHIRPLRTNAATLGWGRSFGRVVIYWLAGFFSGLGLLDVLWCLWDDNRQCLHDKVVDSIVINDPPAPGYVGPNEHPGHAPAAQPWAPSPTPGAWGPPVQPGVWGPSAPARGLASRPSRHLCAPALLLGCAANGVKN